MTTPRDSESAGRSGSEKPRPDGVRAAGDAGAADAFDGSGFATLCQHYAEQRLAHGGAAAPPLYQTSTFVYPDAEAFELRDEPRPRYYDYTRRSNPTTGLLEAKLARLERGTWARCFSSGMGAITCAINACIGTGAHVVAVAGCYSPTRNYLNDYLKRFEVQTTFVHGTRPEDFIAAMRPQTRLIYLESPTSARFEVIELAPIIGEAKKRGIAVIFDNSWSSPYFQSPLEHGADMIVHSATKFIGGHSDTVAGVVMGRDPALGDRVRTEAEMLGASMDPFAAWLLLRGLRTLALRMEQHQRSAVAIATDLAQHPRVRTVHYSGLPGHPGHAVARRQMRGFSSLFSFELHDQSRAATNAFINRLKLFSIGVSWGGHESLAIGGTLFNAGATDSAWVIRLHVGLESTEDLRADVRQALEA